MWNPLWKDIHPGNLSSKNWNPPELKSKTDQKHNQDYQHIQNFKACLDFFLDVINQLYAGILSCEIFLPGNWSVQFSGFWSWEIYQAGFTSGNVRIESHRISGNSVWFDNEMPLSKTNDLRVQRESSFSFSNQLPPRRNVFCPILVPGAGAVEWMIWE